MSVYAVSDLHGMYELYQKISNFLKPEDKVYCLGDCGDRGPQPWETIKAVASDPRFIYIKGNHEDMLAKTMEEYIRYDSFGKAFHLLAMNGGAETLQSWIAEGANISWKKYLNELPAYLEYENEDGIKIVLCHAGLTPGYDLSDKKDLLWDRSHIYDDAQDDNIICVHGHTPILSMISGWDGELKRIFGAREDNYDCGAFWYCNDHKVNIDCGAFFTNTTVLLDLNTFDEHIFSKSNN